MVRAAQYACAICFCCLSVGVIADCPSADLTHDCRVDFADLKLLADLWIVGGAEPNDLTGDSLFGFADFAVLSSQWKAEGTGSGEMVRVPGGTFEMGDDQNWPEERPIHPVALSSFYISKYEITNGQYCRFLNSALQQGQVKVDAGVVYKNASNMDYPYCNTSTSSSSAQIAFSEGAFTVRTKSGRDMSNDPIVHVSWFGAVAYCNWRSEQDGLQACYDLSTWQCDVSKDGYHLATEAQWEYAARGGLSGRRFPWGDTIDHGRANYFSYWAQGRPYYDYDVNAYSGYHPAYNDGVWPYTAPVASFAASGYGLFDMAGNVWEWCNDWFGPYGEEALTDPAGPTTGQYRVVRGGACGNLADDCRVSYRFSGTPGLRFSTVGFRICR